ncbi:MAG: hypothetical protein ISR59_01860 [Anaerolineales bacterium]|uniref:Polymer-forming cytoskeletal protein n=1 Tax=Candidatus Desulfolinea nitratireducens TaxID=2841698 RepID=A0A8J6NQF5_9CHLR|nr:hypothetical protein [Candidatus Desulfolinea nitratireducens]MBL6959825.1 hypothetical protein [Anaerolineales bacterium]
MKNKMKFLSVIMVLMLVLLPTQSVAAKGPGDGPVIFGGTYTLESGDSLDDSVVVFGGVVMIEVDSEVKGDVVVVGGSLTVNGQVNGDVVLIGGATLLGEESLIKGTLSVIGATLNREEGSQVNGEIIHTAPGILSDETRIPEIPGIPFFDQSPLVVHRNPLWAVAGVIGRSVAMGLLAMLVALLLAEPMRRVGEAAASQPAIAGGLGFLTIALAPFVVVVLMITILLIPVGLLAILVLMVALLYGWIALGLEVGERFTKMINQEWPLPLSAAFGTWLLTVIAASIALIPCIGWLVPFVIGTLALGGVIMSRFGSQSVLPPVAEVVDPTPLPPVDGE